MSGGAIGGGRSAPAYFAVFVVGVLIGTIIRAGLAVLPASAVGAIRTRILPGD